MAGTYFNENSEVCTTNNYQLIVTNNGYNTSGTNGGFFGTAVTDCPGGLEVDYPKRSFSIKTSDGIETFGPYDASNPMPASFTISIAPFAGIQIDLAGTILNPLVSTADAFPQRLYIYSTLSALDTCGNCLDVEARIKFLWECPKADFTITAIGNGEFSFTNTTVATGCPSGVTGYTWTGYDTDGVSILWTSNLATPPNYTYPQYNVQYKVELEVFSDCCGSTKVQYLLWNVGEPVAAIALDATDCRAMILETTGTVDGAGNNIEDEITALYSMDWWDSTNNRFIATISGNPYGGLSFDWSSSQLNLLSGTDQTTIEGGFSGAFGTSGMGNSILLNKETVFDVLIGAGECTIDAIEFEFFLTVTYLTKTSTNNPSVIAPICCEEGRHNLPYNFGNFDPAGNLYVPDYNGRTFRMIAPPRTGCSGCGWLKNIAGDPNDNTGSIPADPTAGQIAGDLYRPNAGSIPSLVPDSEGTPVNHSVMGTVYPLFGHDVRGGYPVKLTPNPAVNDVTDWRKNWLIEKIDLPVSVTTITQVTPNLGIIPGLRSNGEPVLMLFNTDSTGADLSICYYDGALWQRVVIYTSPYNEIRRMYWDSQDNGIVFSHSTPLGGGAGPPQLLSYLEFSGTKDIAGITNPANYAYRDINQFNEVLNPLSGTTNGIIDIGTTNNGKPVIYFTKYFFTDAIYEASYNGGGTGTPADWTITVKYSGALKLYTGLAWDGSSIYLGSIDSVIELDPTVHPFDKLKDYSGVDGAGASSPVLESKKF